MKAMPFQMGELIKVKGDVRVNGAISYASQSAFIMNCSLRDNVERPQNPMSSVRISARRKAYYQLA